MNIDHIEIYSESGKADGTIKYLNVFYEDKTNKRINDFDEIGETLSRFMAQNSDKTMRDLLNDKDKIQIYKIVKVEELDPKPEKEETREIVEHQDEEDKSQKKKGSKVAIAALSISSLALAAALIWALNSKDNTGFKSQKTGVPKGPDKTIEQNAEEIHVPITQIYHDDPVEDNGSQFANNLEQAVVSGTAENSLTRLLILDEMSPKEFYYNLEQVNYTLASNMNEIRNLMSGGRMAGIEYLLSLNDYYDSSTKDYVILQEFCGLRNDIVHNAYNQVPEITRQQISSFLDRYLDFAFNGLPVHGIYWNEINPMTKYVITFLGEQMLGPETDYTHVINQQTCDRKTLRENVSQLLDYSVMDELSNRVSRY